MTGGNTGRRKARREKDQAGEKSGGRKARQEKSQAEKSQAGERPDSMEEFL